MVAQDFKQKTKQLIDDLKNVCLSSGLANSGDEFTVIIQIFLYKFLNDKFAFIAKQKNPTLKYAKNWEQEFANMSAEDIEMLHLSIDSSVPKLQPEHLIANLFQQQSRADFDTLFDDTLLAIAAANNEIFSIKTDGGTNVKLFDNLSEYVDDEPKRNEFCVALLNKLVEFSFEHVFNSKLDFFAPIFEYLIKDYNSNSGGKYAEYYTPHAVAKIMANILVPAEQQGKLNNISLYDPAAGSGSLLMNVAHAIGEHNCSIFTQDISQKSSHLLRLNLILNNLVLSIPNVIQGNTLWHPHHKDGDRLKQFDFVVSNPPFKLDFSDFRNKLDDKEYKQRFFAGIPKIPPKDKHKMAIYQLFLQHIIYSLKPTGKAAVVVPTGFITAQSGIDKKIRQHLVDNKMLAGVVSMPSNIFATTGTNVSVVFIDATNKDKVILIDASNLGNKVKEGKNKKTVLNETEEQHIIDTFNNKQQVEDFSVVVSYDEIIEKNYSLSAGQYFEVKIDYIDITATEFNQKMQGFTSNLNDMFKQSRELETEINKQLAGLDFE